MLRYYQYQLPPTLGPVTMERKEKKKPPLMCHTLCNVQQTCLHCQHSSTQRFHLAHTTGGRSTATMIDSHLIGPLTCLADPTVCVWSPVAVRSRSHPDQFAHLGFQQLLASGNRGGEPSRQRMHVFFHPCCQKCRQGGIIRVGSSMCSDLTQQRVGALPLLLSLSSAEHRAGEQLACKGLNIME